ncbi:uncharacterized protein LOC124431896 [Vespa crabro]|uniref:uncharacterized protein LOC124431896 n=1 Tax=Vespa crabro TaxID=7445 RepID=UPI001F0268EA|nr:uncharacterized protein LOC124431896 [Vespa crabro]
MLTSFMFKTNNRNYINNLMIVFSFIQYYVRIETEYIYHKHGMAFYRLNHRSEHIDSSVTMSSSFIDDTLDGYKETVEKDTSMIVPNKKQLELNKIPLEDEKKQQFFKLLHLEKKLDTEFTNLKTSREKYPSMKQTTNLLHEYNDMKDATQVVFGAMAQINNITVKSLHKDYGLPTNDS